MASTSSSVDRQSSGIQRRHGRIVKVAVVGSGLAGLTASYLLATLKARGDVEFPAGDGVEFEVHVFEKVRVLAARSDDIPHNLYTRHLMRHNVLSTVRGTPCAHSRHEP